MAYQTTPTMVSSSIPSKYAKRTMQVMKADTFWGKSVSGAYGGGAIISQSEVLNKPGELITIQVTQPLTGAGISGDTALLEGSEEVLGTTSVTVGPTYRRHGVRLYNQAQKKSLLDLRGEARMRLGEWGRDKLDSLRFTAFTTAGATYDGFGTQNIRYVGGGANDDAVVAANVLTLAELSKVKYLLRSQNAPGWMIDGKLYYMAVVDIWQEYSLKITDTTYATAQREAGIRGATNPLFTGADAIWNGVVIKSADRVLSLTNANAAPARIAKALVFGKEAFVEAWGKEGTWVEKTFDYENEWGVAFGFDYGAKRSYEDYSIQVVSAAPIQS